MNKIKRLIYLLVMPLWILFGIVFLILGIVYETFLWVFKGTFEPIEAGTLAGALLSRWYEQTIKKLKCLEEEKK